MYVWRKRIHSQRASIYSHIERTHTHTHTVSPFCIIMAANNKVIYSVGLLCDRTAPASWHLRQTNDREVTSQNIPGFLFLTLDQLNFIHQIA